MIPLAAQLQAWFAALPGLQGLDVAIWRLVALVILGSLFGGVLSLIALVAIYAERKVSGHMQARLGPMRTGWHGTLQTLADAIKLTMKEDVIPASADKLLFVAGPALVLAGAFAAFAVVPFAGSRASEAVWAVADLDVGLFYLLATSSLVILGVIMSGYGSHSKWALYGAMRGAAQYISYEIPVALHLLPGVLLAGSLRLSTIVAAQHERIWQWHVMPWVCPFATVSFLAYLVANLAETNRTPFDLAESESELVAGYHTEYSGIRWSQFFLAEYAEMFVGSCVAAVVYLGGWSFIVPADSFLPALLVPPFQVLVILVKASVLMFVTMWLRWTLPRVRIDQLMFVCWKVLIPLGLINVIGTALWMCFWPVGLWD